MPSAGDGQVWIYHERQDAQLCGQHALNNLVQACTFSAGMLAEIAQQLDQMELNFMSQNDEGGTSSRDYIRRVAEGSGNVDASGNFSIEVLRSALMTQNNLSLPNIRQEGVLDAKDITEIEGFICNRESHWFAIRKINGRYWNLNSTKERPEQISHFRLAAEIEGLQQSGYSVFCVEDALPPPCTTSEGRERGLPQYWWREDDLVSSKTDAITGATDPWRNVGSGMRLDGKAAGGETNTQPNLENLTEEEMLQMAVEASMMQNDKKEDKPVKEVKLEPEPGAGAAGAVRIQFRLPDGSRVVRRFLDSELVAVLYAFVEDRCPGNGKKLELRAGFPPADLFSQREETIETAKLRGESIQSRYV
eukprot:CAMPEP_0185729884 /NCGR_PEP_ID=MMETSP1171-20130828/7687_1 /TAXON_ID=374046 /ORGANISM="Helicotheca tamensis, Strain CCMP826" /LENGTH=361 /DNA_ID=CAMNT_0028398819 /DNA_START=101 /DNA_END=1186 /DNA_ORIENTATION=-